MGKIRIKCWPNIFPSIVSLSKYEQMRLFFQILFIKIQCKRFREKTIGERRHVLNKYVSVNLDVKVNESVSSFIYPMFSLHLQLKQLWNQILIFKIHVNYVRVYSNYIVDSNHLLNLHRMNLLSDTHLLQSYK